MILYIYIYLCVLVLTVKKKNLGIGQLRPYNNSILLNCGTGFNCIGNPTADLIAAASVSRRGYDTAKTSFF